MQKGDKTISKQSEQSSVDMSNIKDIDFYKTVSCIILGDLGDTFAKDFYLERLFD